MRADEVGAYDAKLLARLRDVLGSLLVGVYASGSVVLGDYVPGKSALDRFVVVERRLADAARADVVAATRHEALPCPARGLELVVYTREAAARPTGEANFDLNLNTGPRMPFHAAYDPADEPGHWFVLDRAIVRERGFALTGPPPADVFAPIPRPVVLAALAASLRWHAESPAVAGENAVLNACRAWCFAADGALVSKAEAAAWARGRVADPSPVDAALAVREGRPGPAPDADGAARLLAHVLARVAEGAGSRG